MTMSNIEQEKTSEKLDNLKPGAELRRATDDLELCRRTFENLGFLDYLNAVNESYLESQGRIEKLKLSISFDLDGEKELNGQRGLGLNKHWPGVSAFLTWEVERKEDLQKNSISITLNYSREYDCYWNSLYACSVENSVIDIRMQVGTSIQRNFWLNPCPELPEYVEDALLTFTTELLDSGFL